MRTPRHHNIVRGVVAALVLLGSLTTLTAVGVRPAAAAPPAARVHAFGLPGYADLVAASKPVIGITATATGTGYWLVATDGGIFSYGGAPFYGSTGGIALHRPVVGMAPTPSGAGYWLVASDGGIFTFGDAGFYGSTGGVALHKPIVGMAATATGAGYWMVGGDGGIFAFGDAGAHGSVPGTGTSISDVTGMGRSAGGNGYVVTARSGAVYAFGDAPFLGRATVAVDRQVVGIATSGAGYWLAETEIPPRPWVGPPLPAGSGVGRRIVYCNSCQRVWHIEADGTSVRSFLVSGRWGTPRAGTYSVYSKSRLAYSGSVTMEYMVRFAYGRTLPIGFHAIPRRSNGSPIQSESQLGQALSAGCVRQADRDALATWNFAPIGTKVVVTA